MNILPQNIHFALNVPNSTPRLRRSVFDQTVSSHENLNTKVDK